MKNKSTYLTNVKRLVFSLITCTLFLVTSCQTKHDETIEIDTKQTQTVTKKKLKSYFKDKGFDITFKKPKQLINNEPKNPLVFNSIKELDNYLKALKEIENNQREDITHVGNDDGGVSDSPNFFTTKIKIGGIVSNIYLNLSFIKKNCEPSSLNTWITGNAHTSTYSEISNYLEKGTSYGTNPKITPIHYGAIGTLTTQVIVAGITVYNTSNTCLTGTHACK